MNQQSSTEPTKGKKADNVIDVQTTKTRGVVIIAMGNQYYIQSAYNLILSIKAQDRNLPVTLVTDKIFDHLFDVQKFMIDHVVKMDGVNPFQVKITLNKISPYDMTLYLDADMIWNPAKPVSELFDSLSGVPFTMANRGEVTGYYDWADMTVFKAGTNIDRLLSLSSEVIYWEKGEVSDKVFDEAFKFYGNNSLVTRRLGHYEPDEPSFAVGMKEAGIEPHQTPYLPSFWTGNNVGHYVPAREIQAKYYLVSMGGAYADAYIVNLYTRYALIAGEKLGCEPFQYIQKRTAVKERANA